LLSYFASKYVRIVTGMPIHDATAGFVCYRRSALEKILKNEIEMKGYGFQIEMKYTAWRMGLKLHEESIIFTERREGASKMSGGIFGEALLGVMKLRFKKVAA
ncbi:MAG: polyprenol monophosphomannose synthase, partial [Alistipes sp.]|nr:polyprenol monophosphomannose synthase [Alistipes sp.]